VSTATESITRTAQAFFDACETGKGWAECSAYCQPNASFADQAEPLADMQTLREYTEWMKGLFALMPDGRYVVESFATDDGRNNVCVYTVFSGTHSATAARCLPPARAPAATTCT
jgi:predicted ester cyclase